MSVGTQTRILQHFVQEQVMLFWKKELWTRATDKAPRGDGVKLTWVWVSEKVECGALENRPKSKEHGQQQIGIWSRTEEINTYHILGDNRDCWILPWAHNTLI